MPGDAPQKRHVLVAEDDLENRNLLVKYLESRGYRVTGVGDGEAAMEALIAKSDIDVVLLDIMMPRMTGFTVLESARGRGIRTPIIMTTAKVDNDSIISALQAGADDYVTKPFSFPVLLARMEARCRPIASREPTMDAEVLELTDEAKPFAWAADEDTPDDVTAAHSRQGLLQRIRTVAEKQKQVTPATTTLKAGDRVADRYVLGGRLGEGSFGVVFRARHVDLARDVAIKVMRPGADQTRTDAFKREAQAASRVRHENAVHIFDFGWLEDGSAFLVMELLEGPTLESEIARGPIFAPRATSIVKRLLSALAAVHRQGMVHRDVKPSNVILHSADNKLVPKLLDFGVAVDLESAADGRSIAGSAAYLAPERLSGRKYDGRADVYAAGIVLYRALTGRYPFDHHPDADFERTALWHLNEAAPQPSTVNSAVPAMVDPVIARMLAKRPTYRPSATEAFELLEGLVWDL